MSWAEELPPGTIVGNTSKHGPGIRFGVVLAPEPCERVRRIINDDPAIWRPAFDELVREAWRRVPRHDDRLSADEQYVQPPPPRLSPDEQFALCWWSVQALAEELLISTDAATDLLEAAYTAGRVQILGNRHFAGIQVDGKWLLVEGRARITQATHEWQVLRALKRELGD